MLTDEVRASERRPLGDVLDTLNDVIDSSNLDQLERAVLGATLAVSPADSATVTLLGAAREPSRSYPNEFFPPDEQSLFEEIHRVSPWSLAQHTRCQDDRPLRISDVYSQRQYRALPIYRDLFKALGIEHQVAFSVPLGEGSILCVAVNRSGGDFTDDEIAWLSSLQRVVRALRADLPSNQARGTSARLVDETSRKGSSLTPREHEVLSLVASGQSNELVGRRLGISARTANKHLQNIFAKLCVSNRTEAALAWHSSLN